MLSHKVYGNRFPGEYIRKGEEKKKKRHVQNAITTVCARGVTFNIKYRGGKKGQGLVNVIPVQ